MPPQRAQAAAAQQAAAQLQQNTLQLIRLRQLLDAAKAAQDAQAFKGLAVRHAARLAERRTLLREQQGTPWKFPNQAALFGSIARSRPLQTVDGVRALDYSSFRVAYKAAHPGSSGKKVDSKWKKFKSINKLPSSLTSCAKLPEGICDNNPNCEYAIGMKRQYCRKVGRKSRRRRSSKKKSRSRRRSSKRKSRSRRKSCSGAREANCNARKNCSWKTGKGCRRSRRRRSRSPKRRSKSSKRSRRSRSKRRCKRGVKKTSPRKEVAEENPVENLDVDVQHVKVR